jgi:Domain of unknown function (DUF4276)
MVTISIIFEGGMLPEISGKDELSKAIRADDFQASNNTLRLIEAFNKLFSSGLTNKTIKINCISGGPDKQAAKEFKSSSLSPFLLVDMEGKKETKPERLSDLGLQEHPNQEKIFFMIQKMEAWILSQPDKIEACFSSYRKPNKAFSIEEDESIKGKNPENIVHPDRLLQAILKRYFEIKRRDKVRDLEYGKLKNAPDLIASLDINRLRKTFEDVDKLLNAINTEGPL